MLPKDFYKLVERREYISHILYGDSVSEDSSIIIDRQGVLTSITFSNLWNNLIDNGYDAKLIGDKEYIFIDKEFKTYSYDIENDKNVMNYPTYIMRHYINKDIMRIHTSNANYIDVTKDHSLLTYNQQGLLKETKPNDADNVLKQEDNKIIPIEIREKDYIPYNGYVYDIEVPPYHNFFISGILVHNTDSIFLVVPKKGIGSEPPEVQWDLADKSSNEINKSIQKFYNEWFFPKCNINPDENRVNFKTELVMDGLMLIDVKKNYAYRTIVQEGKIIENSEVEYKGMGTVKSDVSFLTQEILKDLVVKVVFNNDIKNKDKTSAAYEVIKQHKETFSQEMESYNFNMTPIPGKWSKKVHIINGMKLYNYIIGREIFSFGSAGKFIYCKFINPTLLQGINMKDIKGICIPYTYDVEKLKAAMNKYAIIPDQELQWSKVYHTGCERVLDLIQSLK